MSMDIELNVNALKQLIKAFKDTNPPRARVGIIAGSMRIEGGSTNAEVGARHEFGTTRLPQRSFLRMPLSTHLGSYLDRAGAYDKKKLSEVIRLGNIRPWMEKVAITAESVVIDAFDTGGFGLWKESDMRRKKVHQTLVETQQLRNSITSEVK